MDPISQAFIGSGVAQSFAKNKNNIKRAFFCGAIGGLVPDLDIFIRSTSDSLLSLEYHRHFTHSLFFIPFGGLITAGLLWIIFFYKKKQKFFSVYIFTTLGFATHGLLDSCTAYGTQILWPFSDYRATWNLVSIVDPLFTIPLIGFTLLSYYKKDYKLARSGVYLCLIYLLYGFYNKLSAQEYIEKIAKERGHKIEKIFLSPSLANNILWRSIYKSGDKYYIDAVNVAPFKEAVFYKGDNVDVIDKEKVFPNLPTNSRQRQDIRRFSHFAKDYIYISNLNKNIISDLRYSFVPSGTNSIWGIIIDENNPQNNAQFVSLRRANNAKSN